MPEKSLVSVIILNLNGRHLLKDCLDSLAGQSYGRIETILVDNGSSDGSVELVRSGYPGVRVLVNPLNLGYTLAANQGIRASRGEFVVVLNNDTKAAPDWIEKLADAAASDPRIGICASKQMNFFEPGKFDSAGIQLFRGGYARDRGRGEEDRGQYDRSERIFGAPGASAFYRRSMLDEIGLFDEDYFAYCEEFDLSFRAMLYGWACVYVPAAVVYHKSGATRASRDERFLVYYVERNRLFTIIKNYPVRLFLYCLPYLMKYELDILRRLVFRLEKEVLLARLAALCLMPKMLVKRRLIQRNRKVPVWGLSRFITGKEGAVAK